MQGQSRPYGHDPSRKRTGTPPRRWVGWPHGRPPLARGRPSASPPTATLSPNPGARAFAKRELNDVYQSLSRYEHHFLFTPDLPVFGASMAKLNKFSLYLAKADATNFEDLLTANARDLVKKGFAKKSTSSKFADGAALFPGHRTIPQWVGLLKSSFDLPDVFSQSPCAPLIFRKDKFVFVLTFTATSI
jgi:hypothetical protein